MTTFKSINDSELVKLIKTGAVGVLPTDTVMGLVCQAGNRLSVERLYSLKSREKKPGTIISASVEDLVGLGINRKYLKPVEHYWPNPISVVIPCGPELRYLHQGVGSIAVRIAKNKKVRDLLKLTGPLLTSSANLPGQPESQNIEEAQKYFGGSVDFYVDAESFKNRQSSTIIRIVDDAVEVLRQGSVKVADNGEIIQD